MGVRLLGAIPHIEPLIADLAVLFIVSGIDSCSGVGGAVSTACRI
jgi:hypothetical protein